MERARVILASAALLTFGGAGIAYGHSAAASSAARHWAGISVQPLGDGSLGATATVAAPPPNVYRVLSNERTTTYWAHVARRGVIYTQPRASARHRSRLRNYTEDGFPEVYLLLGQYTDRHGRLWVKLRIPARPNGQTGWVRRTALGGLHVTHWKITVDRHKERLTLYFNGHRRYAAPVAVGKPSSPTPAGHFWIRERFKIRDRRSGYYPYALGTADYSTLTDWPGGGVVGIHGPYGQPQLIPGHPSHGCMRLHVRDDAFVATHITLGTPVQVR